MQKVERKKHGERRNGRVAGVLLCALLLAGCAVAAVLLTRKAEEKPEPSRQPVTGSIVQRNPEELESMTIIPRNGERWTAVQMEDGSLGLEEENGTEGTTQRSFGLHPPLAAAGETPPVPIDASVGEMLVDAAVHLTYEDVFTENRADWEPEAAEFGLADPLITAVFRYADGTETTVRIGNSADPEDNVVYYMTVDGDDRLYAVGAGTVKDLGIEKNVLLPVPKLQRGREQPD